MAFNPKQKILVVDDMSTMRKIIIKMLTQMGCEDITEADDGAPAWELLQKADSAGEPFEFVLSDWNMPGLSGLSLVKKMRRDERFHKTPFLMITAEGDQGNVIAAVKAGVSNFIVKPFNMETLTDKIGKIFP